MKVRAVGAVRLSLVVISLALAAVVSSGPALADDDNTAKAKQLFNEAEQHFANGDFAEASKLYQEAYKLKPLNGFLLNIGQCYRGLGQYEKAIEHYKRYIEGSQNELRKADARRLIKVCEEELAKQPPKPAPEEQPPQPEEKPTPKPPRSKGLPPLVFWSGVGVTSALLLTGIITGATALSKSSEYQDPNTPYGELQGLKDSGKAARTASTVTFVLCAVAATATTLIYFYTDFGPKEASMAAGPIEGGGLLVLQGRF
jgi:tetratricopeptide (TPR) repeat protein